LLLDLEQERPELRIGLHRRNGGRFSRNIVGREGSDPYQQEAGADRYRPPRQARSIPAPPLGIRVAAKSATIGLLTKYELEHIFSLSFAHIYKRIMVVAVSAPAETNEPGCAQRAGER
jgi:hypothetical protein